MLTIYIENHELFGSLTKNCPKLDKNKSIVSRFSVIVFYKSAVSIVQRKQLRRTFQFSSLNVCICTSNSVIYTILQNKRMRRCEPPPPPPPPSPIIFERLKLPQQIIYRRKGNLSESPNHQKYWGNILISRFMSNFREVVEF